MYIYIYIRVRDYNRVDNQVNYNKESQRVKVYVPVENVILMAKKLQSTEL